MDALIYRRFYRDFTTWPFITAAELETTLREYYAVRGWEYPAA